MLNSNSTRDLQSERWDVLCFSWSPLSLSPSLTEYRHFWCKPSESLLRLERCWSVVLQLETFHNWHSNCILKHAGLEFVYGEQVQQTWGLIFQLVICCFAFHRFQIWNCGRYLLAVEVKLNTHISWRGFSGNISQGKLSLQNFHPFWGQNLLSKMTFYPLSDVQYSSDLLFVPGPEMSLLCALLFQIKTLSFTQDAMFILSSVNLEMTFNPGTPCGLETLKEINSFGLFFTEQSWFDLTVLFP